LVFFGAFLASCATNYSEKMYADVIGFNDAVMPSYMQPPKNPKATDVVKPIPGVIREEGKPYDLLNQTQTEAMREAINKVPSGQNTAALYALDVGLDRVVEINKKFMEGDPKSRYYVVFFTDGIDNASIDMAIRTRRGNYSRGAAGRDEYGAAMHNRMQQIINKYRFFGLIKKPSATNSFQSYVLLFQGPDLKSYSDQAIETILKPFSASQNADTPALIKDRDMGRLLEKFQDSFVIPSFTFSVPKDYAGQRIRMQLSAKDQVFFEADVRHQTRNKFIIFKEDFYTLENVTVSDGFTFDEYAKDRMKIEMDKESYDVNANTVPFIINGLKLGDKPYPVMRNEVSQWHHDMGAYVQNKEYVGIARSKKNAYVLLIMDTSLSLGEYAEEAKETAAEIVRFINEQM
jgi:hypothetical protein